MSACPACGAAPGTIGVTARQLCPTCVHREKVTDAPSLDRNFGDGMPSLIAQECYALRDMLHEKNRKYGNSALEPVRIFSRASPEEQILVRLDDKLSRLKSGQPDEDEDVVRDISGYLILLRVARRLPP